MPSALRSIVLLIVLLIATSARAEEPTKPQLAAPPAKLELANGDGIVFLGDSITHQCLYTQYVEDYFYTRFPKQRLRFHNSGVSGDRCSDALTRFDRDVAAYKPKYVTVLLGMNDGGVRAYDEETFQTYKRDMNALLERITGIGATPILITPTMFDSRAGRAMPKPRPPEALEYYNATLAYYGAWLRGISTDRGLRFVDMYSPLNNFTFEARKKDPAFTLIRDAVHPDAPGQVVMAFAMLMDLGVSRKVSTISLTRGDEKPTVKATGAKVTDVRFSSDGVEFDVAAESLPLALPADAQTGVKLVSLGHRLGQEAIDVHGLEPGRYQLLIDDAAVGVFTHDQLERHVELQANMETPQYKQALTVAELNRRRNDEAMRPLRGLWQIKKTQRSAQLRFEADPNDLASKKQADDLKGRLVDFGEKIARFEAAARKIEDEIFATNQPPVRHYRLTRLK